jgi:hypothetical protein
MTSRAAGIGPRVHLSPYTDAVDCIAGFFDTQAQAEAARWQLHHTVGLSTPQGALLGPELAPWLAFWRRSRAWRTARCVAGRPWTADAPLMTAAGGLVATLFAMVALAVDGRLGGGPTVLVVLAAMLAGATGGWAASVWSADTAHHRRFRRDIRRQLAAGRWVVLAQDVSGPQQDLAAGLLRDHSAGWCAVYAPWRPL